MVEPPIDFLVSSDKDAIASTPTGDGQHILVSANCYADNPYVDAAGALIEETSAFRSDIELFYRRSRPSAPGLDPGAIHW
ncbi:MAG: hypothetical protein ACOCQY_05230 [Halorhabdus sp.]